MSELREHLMKLDADLGHQLHTLWAEAKAGIHDHVATKEGHQGGAPHSEAVEHNLWRLVTETKQALRPIEWFILSAAAALHDAGKVPFGDDFDPGLDHGELSERRIRQRAGVFGLDAHTATIVGMVVRPHNNGSLFEILPQEKPLGNHGSISIRKLAAMLRVADILHIDHRVSPQVDCSDSPNEKVRNKTLFRKCVGGWILADDGQAIMLDAEATTTEEYEAILSGSELTAKDLEPIAATLEVHGFPYRFVNPEINTDQIKWAETKKATSESAVIGLDYYRVNDADAFKGRSRETDELLARVLAHPVSLLVGASGAGKTSLIHAGLFARLKRSDWEYLYTRPKLSADQFIYSEELPDYPTTCVEFIQKYFEEHKGKNTLICLDQFEDATQLLSADTRGDLRRALSIVQSGRFANLRVLVSYRVEAEAAFGSLWQDVSGSATGLPKVYLNPLDRPGAKEALLDALQRREVGLEPTTLLETILNELGVETLKAGYSAGVYPPYLHMLAQTIIESVKDPDRILRDKEYAALGGAETMIGEYLLKTLEKLGEDKDAAERVLRALSSSTGRKTSSGARRISAEASVDIDRVKSLLSRLVKLRLVRMVGSECEIAHDHLASLVNRQRDDDETGFIRLREVMAAKARVYQTTRGTLTSTELLSMYPYRRRIFTTDDEESLIFQSLVSSDAPERTPGWFWLRNWPSERASREYGRWGWHYLIAGTDRDRSASTHAYSDRPDLPCGIVSDGHQGPGRDKEGSPLEVFIQQALGSETEYDVWELEVLLDDEDPATRVMAIRGLVKHAVQYGSDLICDHLQFALDDACEDVQLAAAMAAVHVLAGGDICVLEDISHSPKHEDTWRIAVKTLLILPGYHCDSIAHGLLDADDTDLRRLAMEALGRTGSKKHIPALVRLLNHANERVRYDAIRALGQSGTRKHLRDLVPLLGNADDVIRLLAAKACASLASTADLAQLKKMFVAADPEEREAICQVLQAMGARDTAAEIVDMCDDITSRLLIKLDRLAYMPTWLTLKVEDLE